MTGEAWGTTFSDSLRVLSHGLMEAGSLRIESSILSPNSLRSILGEERFSALSAETSRASILGQLEAVSEFVLQVVYAPGFGESLDSLLGSEPDPVDGVREFANLRRLRALAEVIRPAGSDGDVPERFDKGVAAAEHGSPSNGDDQSVGGAS